MYLVALDQILWKYFTPSEYVFFFFYMLKETWNAKTLNGFVEPSIGFYPNPDICPEEDVQRTDG